MQRSIFARPKEFSLGAGDFDEITLGKHPKSVGVLVLVVCFWLYVGIGIGIGIGISIDSGVGVGIWYRY